MSIVINLLTLPLIGEVGLSSSILWIFLLCILACIIFEFVNGFHDTANAVATVIYTKALKPQIAVPWSGLWNFIGISLGGIGVAMGILKLVPLNELMSLPVQVGACLVLSVLLASITWNLGTWYMGIPCSSSHTMIGAMIGAELAFTHFYGGSGVNWSKAKEIGLSLLLSPLLGFGAAALLMLLLKNVLKSTKLFHVPEGDDDKPPLPVRILLICTCTLVSFFHGSNDGQKGVGLLMLILIAFLPAKFAINHTVSDHTIGTSLNNIEQSLKRSTSSNPTYKKEILVLDSLIAKAKKEVSSRHDASTGKVFKFRKTTLDINKELKPLLENKKINISESEKTILKKASKDLSKVTDYAPLWVIITISISLGLGTMIGWKRIVVTVGEKIGKEQLNYAQGATAELVAASTIGLSTGFGLPVSTTHVLSSGVAGAMVSSGGAKNSNNDTLKNIVLAWVLTVPVSIVLAGVLFVVLHLLV